MCKKNLKALCFVCLRRRAHCSSPLASPTLRRVCNLCLNPGVRWKGEMKRHYKGEIGSADKSTQRASESSVRRALPRG